MSAVVLTSINAAGSTVGHSIRFKYQPQSIDLIKTSAPYYSRSWRQETKEGTKAIDGKVLQMRQ